MPVHFKGRSEYDSHYKWFESYKSLDFSPSPEQAADPAGLASAELGTFTQSEYKSHYKTFQSRKSASYEPTPEQAALAAGQASTKLGIVADPPLQSKKRTTGPSATLGVDYYEYNQNDNNRADNDYALLGANDKFVPNIRYKYKGASNNREASPPKQQKLIQRLYKQGKSKENIEPSQPVEDKPAPVVNTEIYQQPPTPLAPRRPKYESALSKEVSQTKDFSLENMNKQESITKAELKDKDILKQEELEAGMKTKENQQKKAIIKSAGKSKTEKVDKFKTYKKPPPTKTVSQVKDSMNEFTQTNMDKGIADSAPEAPTEYAMKYKAGVAPPRPRKKFSEYQKQFTWKDGGKSSPLLDAEQVIYKSNANISPTKKDVVPKVSEYRNQFKEWKYKPVPEEELTGEKPRKRSKVRRSKSMGALSPDRLRAAGSSPVVSPDNKRLTKEFEQQKEESMPEKERVPKITQGKMKRAKSEYDANFKSPSAYSYEKGAWKGVYPPHLQSSQTEEVAEEKVPALSNWFAEVIELRRKAAEYKKRAQGTHFSREHIVQLMAKQTEMWDAVSSRSGSSTISALSLESGASARARKQQRDNVVEEDNDNKSDRATMATEDDHHGSDKDFKEANSNLRQRKESRSVGITAKEKYLQKSKQERKQRKKAWTDEPMSPGSQNLDDFEDDDGRIPTPVLRSEKKSRHHFDLTTPCVGGALLTSPPAARKEYSSRPTPTSKSWSGPYQDLYEDSDDDTLVDVPPAPVTGPPVFDLKKGNIAPTPTYGMPSRDSHFLRDDSESVDQPLTTSYVHSPIKLSTSTENKESPPQKQRRSKLSNAKKGLGIPSTVQEGFGQTYNKQPGDGLVWSIDGGLPVPRRDVDDDDVLSTSARSIASSCSVASETLERARKRKEEFWGKNGIATR